MISQFYVEATDRLATNIETIFQEGSRGNIETIPEKHSGIPRRNSRFVLRTEFRGLALASHHACGLAVLANETSLLGLGMAIEFE